MKKSNILLVSIAAALLFCCAVIKSNNMNSNEIGLSVLGWIKKTLGNKVDLKSMELINGEIMDHQDWNSLVQKHVALSGDVDYNGIVKDSLLLNCQVSQGC